MAEKHLPGFFISSDKNSCESLLSKMAVNWICRAYSRKYGHARNFSEKGQKMAQKKFKKGKKRQNI